MVCVHLSMRVCVMSVWVPTRDYACVKRVGEAGDALYFSFHARWHCFGDEIVWHLRTVAAREER